MRLTSGKLVIASHNKGKVREIAALLGEHGIEPVSASELGLPEPEETGATFAENALLKAHAAAQASGLPALADDSGLCVEALGGAPGIYSSRWAGGGGGDFTLAMQRIEDELATLGQEASRAAHFICALALAFPNGEAQVYEGRVDGALAWPVRGTQGFGYDPMFVPHGHALTFGEMEPAAKHAMSHRAHAFALLVEAQFGAA
jgi:XTP/dITP diphosphohydrolase